MANLSAGRGVGFWRRRRRQRSRRAVGFAAVVLGATAVDANAHALRPGLEAGAIYIQDYFHNVKGGLERGGGWPGIVHLNLAVDGRQWGGAANNAFFLDLLGTFGDSISEEVGDVQTLDNIEAYNTFKVFEAWYEHSFGDSGFSVRLGLQDYNALFNVLDAAGVLMNSSFGLDGSIAQSNVSQFAVTAVGGVLRWESPRGIYVMGGVYDGVPGLPGHPAGTRIEFRSGEGIFSALEAGLIGDGDVPGKIAIGGWYQTSEITDPTGRARDDNHGVYLIAEKRLIGGKQSPALDAFVQFGTAQDAANILDRYIGAGVDVTGLARTRPDDVLSVGMARVHSSDAYQSVTPNAAAAETVVELTYQLNFNEHLFIQPDVQYVIDPGPSEQANNAWVPGVRAGLAW